MTNDFYRVPVQALAMLKEAEEGARASKHQYLSGVLHNAAKILDANSSAPAAPEQALHALGLAPGEQQCPGVACMPQLAVVASDDCFVQAHTPAQALLLEVQRKLA